MPTHRFVIAERHALLEQALLPETGTIVVACSGGADSLALLHSLHALCGRSGTAFPGVTLHVAHLDHGLRGVESAADAAFVAAEAQRLGLTCTIGAIAAAERRAWRGSLEASLRMARYAFLRDVARATEATAIALGHTADDQAETIVLHLMRGSGLDGLAGMRPRSGDLIRPLLGLWRADTEGYCRDLGLMPRTDPSNRDLRFTRNRIRHELIPLIETMQARFRQTIVRNSALIADDRDALEAMTNAAWPTLVRDESELDTLLTDEERVAWRSIISIRCKGESSASPGPFGGSPLVLIDRAALRAIAPAIRHRVLRRAIASVGMAHPDDQVDAASIARLERVALDRSGVPRVVECSTGAFAFVARRAITIHPPLVGEDTEEHHAPS